MKLSDAQKDYYRKLAKEEGYRSRSAFKLIQLNKAYRILKPGYSVVDLGCAPGWLQVARTAVSQSGKVIGVWKKLHNWKEQQFCKAILRMRVLLTYLCKPWMEGRTLYYQIFPRLAEFGTLILQTDFVKQSSMNIATETLVEVAMLCSKEFWTDLIKRSKLTLTKS